MPTYVDQTGKSVSASIAAFPDGRARPGYREILGDGERVPMNIHMMDAATVGDVMTNDAAINAAVARERMIHDSRFAFMGANAPAFDHERATFLARSALAAEAARGVRDTALAGQYLPVPSAAADRVVTDAYAEMVADMTGDADRAARDFARASQYR